MPFPVAVSLYREIDNAKTNKKRTVVLGNCSVAAVYLQCGIEVSMSQCKLTSGLQTAKPSAMRYVLPRRNVIFVRRRSKARCSLTSLATPYVAFRYR